MSTLIRFSICIMTFALAGCQSMPPVSPDKYYRLEAAPGSASARTILNETLYVAPLRADGSYAERAMLYTTVKQPRELQQYHYQYWIEPPAVLLQEHMRASFEAMSIAPHVTDISMGSDIGYLLNARILRLEKITDGGNARAVVSLHFALQRMKPFEMILERSYSAEVVVNDNTQYAYVLACEAGLKKIYANFFDDLISLR